VVIPPLLGLAEWDVQIYNFSWYIFFHRIYTGDDFFRASNGHFLPGFLNGLWGPSHHLIGGQLVKQLVTGVIFCEWFLCFKKLIFPLIAWWFSIVMWTFSRG
jgi:hypothetical protein